MNDPCTKCFIAGGLLILSAVTILWVARLLIDHYAPKIRDEQR